MDDNSGFVLCSCGHGTVEEHCCKHQRLPVGASDKVGVEPSPADGGGGFQFEPQDGGWGWVVCFAAFWCNGTIFGIMNCFGVLYVDLEKMFAVHHTEAAFLTSWVGSVCIGMTFLLSPLSSILTDRYGIRITAFCGGLLATFGMVLSSFVTKVELLYLTYGVIMGTGSSLAYTPSLVILGHYFKKRIGLVNGIVTAGSSIFTMVMPLLLRYLLDHTSLKTTLQILSGMLAMLMVCSLSFRPQIPKFQDLSYLDTMEEKPSWCQEFFHKYLTVSIWKNRRYVLWVFAIPIALFGYFVPYVHLVKHVKLILPEENGELLVTCIGLTSGVGRIVFGKIADFRRVNRIHLQQISFLSIGILTMLLVVAKQFAALIIMCLFLGLFDGCFISLLGPIAFDIVGNKGASQAIGFLLGFCSIPLTVGPPIAGLLFDHLGNYQIAFLAAGIPPLIGAAVMCLIHRVPGQGHVHIHIHQQPSVIVEKPRENVLPEEKQRLVDGYQQTSPQPEKSQKEIVWEKRQLAPCNGSLANNGRVYHIPARWTEEAFSATRATDRKPMAGKRASSVPVEAAQCLLERESSV